MHSLTPPPHSPPPPPLSLSLSLSLLLARSTTTKDPSAKSDKFDDEDESSVSSKRFVDKAVARHTLRRSAMMSALETGYAEDASYTESARRRSAMTSSKSTKSKRRSASNETHRSPGVKKMKSQRVRPAKWKELERQAFLTHLAEVGDDWAEMQRRLPSRTLMQIRSYFSKNKAKLNLGPIVQRASARNSGQSASIPAPAPAAVAAVMQVKVEAPAMEVGEAAVPAAGEEAPSRKRARDDDDDEADAATGADAATNAALDGAAEPLGKRPRPEA